ncbi:MAG: hypothetical protein WCJ81_08555 [bacterium]
MFTHKKHIFIGIAWAIGAIAILIYYGNFTLQSTTQAPGKTSLEHARGLSEGSLHTVSGKVMIGPSRAVWKEWTAWLQGESSLDFRLYNYTFEDMQRRMRQQAAHGVTIQ